MEEAFTFQKVMGNPKKASWFLGKIHNIWVNWEHSWEDIWIEHFSSQCSLLIPLKTESPMPKCDFNKVALQLYQKVKGGKYWNDKITENTEIYLENMLMTMAAVTV